MRQNPSNSASLANPQKTPHGIKLCVVFVTVYSVRTLLKCLSNRWRFSFEFFVPPFETAAWLHFPPEGAVFRRFVKLLFIYCFIALSCAFQNYEKVTQHSRYCEFAKFECLEPLLSAVVTVSVAHRLCWLTWTSKNKNLAHTWVSQVLLILHFPSDNCCASSPKPPFNIVPVGWLWLNNKSAVHLVCVRMKISRGSSTRLVTNVLEKQSHGVWYLIFALIDRTDSV